MSSYWVKTQCQAKIKSLVTGETAYGQCTHLSVEGLVLRVPFVPQYAEPLRVTMIPASVGASQPAPLVAETEVRHCQAVEEGLLYDIGVIITNRH